VRAFKFPSRFRDSWLGADAFPKNDSKKAVSMLRLASAGSNGCDASAGSVGGPGRFRTDRRPAAPEKVTKGRTFMVEVKEIAEIGISTASYSLATRSMLESAEPVNGTGHCQRLSGILSMWNSSKNVEKMIVVIQEVQ